MQVNDTLEQTANIAPNDTLETPNVEQTQDASSEMDNASSAVSFGKFKSAESMYAGYQQLEKEFTKKCQLLKEYESKSLENRDIMAKMLEINPELSEYLGELSDNASPYEIGIHLANKLIGNIVQPCKIINDKQFLEEYVYSNEKIIDKIILDYMDSLSRFKVPQTIKSGGNSYVSPTYRPRSLDEAGKMAKKFIENRRI